jgi:hypothetical protein
MGSVIAVDHETSTVSVRVLRGQSFTVGSRTMLRRGSHPAAPVAGMIVIDVVGDVVTAVPVRGWMEMEPQVGDHAWRWL